MKDPIFERNTHNYLFNRHAKMLKMFICNLQKISTRRERTLTNCDLALTFKKDLMDGQGAIISVWISNVFFFVCHQHYLAVLLCGHSSYTHTKLCL